MLAEDVFAGLEAATRWLESAPQSEVASVGEYAGRAVETGAVPFDLALRIAWENASQCI